MTKWAQLKFRMIKEIDQKLCETLETGGIVIACTDTIYGILGQALSQEAVERIYCLKNRDENKPFVILVSSIRDLSFFSVKINSEQRKVLKKYWPGKVSVVLKCDSPDLEYLHRGTKTLAFRLPENRELRKLIRKTGPLVAPSANPKGIPPAKTISEARRFFAAEVDYYENNGALDSPPSTIISLDARGKIEIMRQGTRN